MLESATSRDLAGKDAYLMGCSGFGCPLGCHALNIKPQISQTFLSCRGACNELRADSD